MSKSLKWSALLLAIICVVGGALVYQNLKKPVAQNEGDGAYFNAAFSISDTTLTVAYPKEGFLKSGAKINPENGDPNGRFGFLGGVGIVPDVNPQTDNFSTVLSVGAYKLPENQTLSKAVNSGIISNIEIGTVRERGTYETIGGHEFFIYKDVVNTTNGTWKAISFGKKEAVFVAFQFDPEIADFTKTPYGNDQALFRAILAHLQFE